MKRPSRRVIDVLEKAFCREISGTLPFQSKAKICAELCEQGLLSPMEENFSGIKVSGYQLTHVGRIIYCTAAAPKAGKGDA